MSAQDTLREVIRAAGGEVSTHYQECYLHHAACLAQRLTDAGEVTMKQDALAYLLELACDSLARPDSGGWARSLREALDSPERAAQLRDLAEQIGIEL